MSALTGEPFRGIAVVYIENDVGANDNWRRYSVSVDDFDLTTDAPADQTTWEGAPGGSLTLRFEWGTEGAPLAGAADAATVRVHLPGGAQVGSTWSPAVTGASGVLTRTFHFDDDPLNETLGALRHGTLEVFLEVRRNSVVSWGPADSRGTYTNPAATTHNDFGRGYLRASRVLSSNTVPSNVSIGGASPSTFAFPDPIHTRVSLSAVSYRSVQLELELLRTGTSTVERESTLTQTAADHDYSWTATGSSGASRTSLGIFPAGSNTAAAEAKDLRVKLTALDFGGDNEYVWAASGHASGWARDSDLQMTKSAVATFDSRLYPTGGDMGDWSMDRGALFQKELAGQDFFDPPSLGDDPTGQRSFPNVAYLGVRYLNARGEGQNSITVTLKTWDASGITGTESSPTHSLAGQVTRTSPDPPPTPASPEAGWLPRAATGVDENKLPITWSTVAGDVWRVKSVATAPSDTVGLERHALDDGSNSWDRNVFFSVVNPNLSAQIEIHPENIAGHGSHLTSDDELVPVTYLVDHSSHELVELVPANGDQVHIMLLRTHHPTMRLDYFDFVTESWVEKTDGGAIPDDGRLVLVRGSTHTSGGDPDVWTTSTHIGGAVFTPDPAGELDFVIVAVFTYNGVNYAIDAPVILVGPNFRHNSYNETTIPFDSRGAFDIITLTGTATATNDSGTVTGSGTLFTSELSVGSQLQFDSEAERYEVFRIDSDTSIRIFPYYVGTTGSGKVVKNPGTGHTHLGSADSSAAIGGRGLL